MIEVAFLFTYAPDDFIRAGSPFAFMSSVEEDLTLIILN